jgi:hypothetical protein
MAQQLGVISSNEELEDIATADLKFVLTDYYLGSLLQKGQSPRSPGVTRWWYPEHPLGCCGGIEGA